MRKFASVISLVVLMSCVEDTLTGKLDYDFSPANIVTFRGNITAFADVASAKGLGFRSIDDYYQEALEKLEQVQTEDEVQAILKEYARFIELRDDTYFPIMQNDAHRAICNLDGLYAGGGFVHKAFNDGTVIFTEMRNVNDLLKINSIVGIDTKKIRVAIGQSTSVAGGRTKASCGYQLDAEYFYNPAGCKNDRKVWLHANTNYTNVGNDYTVWASIKADGTRRGPNVLWCNFYHYNTVLRTRNCAFMIKFRLSDTNYYFQKTTADMPDYVGTEEEAAYQPFGGGPNSGPYGEPLNYGSPITFTTGGGPSVEFFSITAEASSQGVGYSNWAVINCQ